MQTTCAANSNTNYGKVNTCSIVEATPTPQNAQKTPSEFLPTKRDNNRQRHNTVGGKSEVRACGRRTSNTLGATTATIAFNANGALRNLDDGNSNNTCGTNGHKTNVGGGGDVAGARGKAIHGDCTQPHPTTTTTRCHKTRAPTTRTTTSPRPRQHIATAPYSATLTPKTVAMNCGNGEGNTQRRQERRH